MPRKTIPMSEKQQVNLKYLAPDQIEEYLDGYVEVGNRTGDPYYLHIDHCQILPANEHGNHPVFVVFHRVYLHKG